VEEEGGGDAGVGGVEAPVELLVAVGFVIAGVEAAEAVEVGSALFTQGISEGKTDTDPGIVIDCDIQPLLLDLTDHLINILLQEIHIGFEDRRGGVEIEILIPGDKTQPRDILPRRIDRYIKLPLVQILHLVKSQLMQYWPAEEADQDFETLIARTYETGICEPDLLHP